LTLSPLGGGCTGYCGDVFLKSAYYGFYPNLATDGGSSALLIPLANPSKQRHRDEQKQNGESEREEAH